MHNLIEKIPVLSVKREKYGEIELTSVEGTIKLES
jgi:hypothetical protein